PTLDLALGLFFPRCKKGPYSWKGLDHGAQEPRTPRSAVRSPAAARARLCRALARASAAARGQADPHSPGDTAGARGDLQLPAGAGYLDAAAGPAVAGAGPGVPAGAGQYDGGARHAQMDHLEPRASRQEGPQQPLAWVLRLDQIDGCS